MTEDEFITMLHGAGGSVMHDLVEKHILRYLGNLGKFEVPLEALADAAVVDGIVLKSDSHAVKPIFFPGGDIGRLAISGTINDISVLGAQPTALTCGLILEEGLPIGDLDRILDSMRATCSEANVAVVTGDTKVIEKGSLGGCVVNTSGIGKRTEALNKNLEVVKKFDKIRSHWILDSNLRPGDKLILSGTIGDHGLAILSAQEGIEFGSSIVSDVRPLNRVIQLLLGDVGGITAMKDPTRGGLSDALNELSNKSNVGILVEEKSIPINEDVLSACEMLGLDPLEVGNEGKIIIGVIKEKAQALLALLRITDEGKEAQIMGEATADFRGVAEQTIVGGKRIIPRPLGDPIPRIC